MNRAGSTSIRTAGMLFILVCAAVVGYLLLGAPTAPVVVPIKPPLPATTQTAAATLPTTKPHVPIREYMDVVLAHDPDFPTTRPLSTQVSLSDAALIEIKEPVYLDSRSETWITRADAEELPDVFKRVSKQTSHVLREKVLFVHYWPDSRGTWRPNLVVARGDGSSELVSVTARKSIGSRNDYLWDRAFSRENTIVVPTKTGMSVISLDVAGAEQHVELLSAALAVPDVAKLPEPVVLQDPRGLIAWIPWDNTEPGGDVVARFVDNKWQIVPSAAGIPPRVIYIMPLRDGTYLTISLGERNLAVLSRAILDPPQIDEAALLALVTKLGDADPEVRRDTEDQITQFGPGAWPTLERVKADQPPEAQTRIQRLLRDKLSPRLNQITLLPGSFRTIAHLSDNGVVFYCDAGISVLNVSKQDGAGDVITPAWIALRPGKLPEVLVKAFTHDVDPNLANISALADEWLLYDDAAGIHRLLGNHIEPMLPSKYSDWGYCVGIDRDGRWLFRKGRNGAETLFLDPTLPDPTPKLPVWRQPANPKSVGWTKEGWPVVKSEEAWILKESRWEKLPEGETIITQLDETPATQPTTATPTTTTSTTRSTTGPTTGLSAEESDKLGPPLLSMPDGTRYYDGETTITRLGKDGKKVVWPLPAEATGMGDIWIIAAAADRLFLFNQQGRVLRIRDRVDSAENAGAPFVIEATFTRKIPESDHFTRIWRDPAGRIVMVWDEDKMSILFPAGQIPGEIANLMPAAELQEEDTEKLPGAN